MTDLAYYSTIKAWWAQYDARHYRITCEGDTYIATYGLTIGRGLTIAAAVQVAAMRAHKTQRCFDTVPF